MNPHEKYLLCLEKAKAIVAAHRAEAPEGCDPQSSWVAIGVGVAGIAVSAGTSAYQSNQAKKQAGQLASNGQKTLPPVDFPNMPAYVPADFNKLDYAANLQDVRAYNRSDAAFKRRHPQVLAAEKAFENRVAADQRGDSTFIPQMQAEAVNAGLGSALDAFGDQGGSLTMGSGAEADVAKNLGLSIAGFQDRNRANANQSLSLAEQIFPRRNYGLNGQDAAQIALGNLSAQNAWNQANHAEKVDELQFNQKIAAGNTASQIQSSNAAAAAQAQLGAAQSQMYGSMAQSAVGLAGTYAGSPQAQGWAGNTTPYGVRGTATYAGKPVPTATAITARA